MDGYIKLNRKFFTNPFWNEDREFSKCEAWLDMIQLARIEQSSVIVNGKVIELQRGQLCASIRYLAKRWSWGEQRVRTYLKLCIKIGMITQQQHSGETVVTLVKYRLYNDKQHTDEGESNTELTQSQHSDNTGLTQSKRKKELKKEIKEDIPMKIPDLKEFGEFALEHKPNVDKMAISLKYNAWKEAGWKDGHGKDIKSWKSKLLQTLPYLPLASVNTNAKTNIIKAPN